jgi:hypothetical protein
MSPIIKVNLKRDADVQAHHGHGANKAEDCPLCYPAAEPIFTPPEEGGETGVEEEAEDYGPKTAAMPDPESLESAKLREMIDVRSLPEDLRERAWWMLENRIGAFGFDGRLGQHLARVHIRTLDGQVPIAVPMYGSSPAKRLVIDKQLDKWFEQGVIEPSISPWSAPVVIAYRNRKPRFCVDYRN